MDSASGTSSTALQSTSFRFASTDCLQIACARWDSVIPIRGVLQIAHGMGEHMGRYRHLIGVLVHEGLTVYANDHRGHGLSARSPEDFGNFGPGGFDLLVSDIVHLSRRAKRENPGKPFILLGHSMGSFAAQQVALDHSHEIDALILSGSGALDGLAQLAGNAEAGQNVLNARFEPARTPFDWLSRDTSVADAFARDPLCFAQLQPASFASFLAAAGRLSDPLALAKMRPDLPVYLFSGSEDPVGQQLEGLKVLIDRYRKAGLSDIATDFYNGGRHEMLNEINREEVISNLVARISNILARPPVSGTVSKAT